MTETQEKSMIDRLNAAMPKEVLTALSQIVVLLTVSIMDVNDDATSYDYGTAVENLMDSLLGEESSESDFKGKPRPATDDDRPLYLRLEEYTTPKTAAVIRTCWSKLNLMSLLIADVELAKEFLETVVKPFADAFGIPSRSEYDANPDAYAKVRPDVLESIVQSAKVAAKPADRSADYRLAR